MWVTIFFISPLKIRIFARIHPNLARNWHFCSFWARPCWLILCPVGGLVGGCGAVCISQDTYLLYDYLTTPLRYIAYETVDRMIEFVFITLKVVVPVIGVHFAQCIEQRISTED